MTRASLYIVVVGCGRVGSHLAGRLSHEGHSVVVIDRDENAFASLPAEFSGFRVEGDATEAAVLHRAKVDRADAVVAVTDNDNVNAMVAQIAGAVFKVTRVIARLDDPSREDVYRDLGIETVCPTIFTADIVADRMVEVVRRAGS
jgi:trk system potassium uptake protein TrkA